MSDDRAQKISARLVDIAGMSLAKFEFARRGVEFTETISNSPSADLWVEVPAGRLAIEVKSAAANGGWYIKRKQRVADAFLLIRIDLGQCFILMAEEMNIVLGASREAFPGVVVVRASRLPSDCMGSWHKLSIADLRPIRKASRTRATIVGLSAANAALAGDAPKLPYVHSFRDRHGNARHYLRIPGTPRMALNAELGTPAFRMAYALAVAELQT